MKGRTLGLIGLVAHLIAAGVPAAWLFTTKAAAQSPQTQARGVPVFEVDPAWPKLPPQFKLGDASSFAIDAQDNVWLLHRPRTLKPEDSGKAAPAIVVFDAVGNFMKAWGGAGADMTGPSGSTASISTTRASCGSAEIIVRPPAWLGSSRLLMMHI